MASPVVNMKEFQARLHPLLEEFPGGAVVFDADGTLWKHDVGCMVYNHFCAEQLFLPESEQSLSAELFRLNGKSLSAANSNVLALELQQNWLAGCYEERAMAEMQVWAYVGYRERQFRDLVTKALKFGRHNETIHGEVIDLADWVRARGGRALVVSASPLWVVEEATRAYGFSPGDIAAGVPVTERRPVTGDAVPELIIQAGMAEPLPYGPGKVVAGKQLIQDNVWLAALGDSSFDLEMMAEAKLAGGIGNKPEMLAGLGRLPHGVHLRLE